jgi:GT2 family glycosyltransferase
MEEIDLCWRMQRAGGRIRVAPASTVYHLGGASLPQGHPRKAYLNFRNNLVMLAKNLPDGELRAVLRARRALDAVAAAQAAAGGRPAEARAIRRAWASFSAVRPTLPRPPAGEAPVLPTYRGSVVADYYVRGRRHFSDLPAGRFMNEAT